MPRKKTDSKLQKRSLEAAGFYSDCMKEDMLYAVLIRSPASAGSVKSIVLDDIPEGYQLFTAEDIPGSKKIEINKASVKIFGYGAVSYSGEPLGILVGPDEHKVIELSEKVSVNFDIASLESALNKVIKSQKKPVISMNEVSGKASMLHQAEEVNDLTSFVSEINKMPSLDEVFGKKAEGQNQSEIIAQREVKTGLFNTLSSEEIEEQLFGQDYIITEDEWNQTVIPPDWKETAGAFCFMDGKKLHIHTPTQWTYNVIQTISSVTGLDPNNIFVHKTKTSGIFTKGLWRNSVIASQVALASFLTKHPVQLILSQEEQDNYMNPGVKTEAKYKTSVTKDGTIKAVSAEITFDVGTLNPFAQEIADRMAIVACNFYKPQNIHIKVKAHTSKNPPTSMCIKSADSQILFAIENHIQKICTQASILPQEFLKSNQPLKNSNYPFLIYDSPAKKVLETTLKNSDFTRKQTSFKMDALDRVQKNSNPFFALPLRGIGITTSFNISDYYGSDLFLTDNKIEVTLISSEKVEIHAIKASPIIQDIWKSTAAEILQLPKECVEINSDYTLEEIPKSPENINTTIGISNELIKKCCNEIQKKRFHQPLPISSKKGIANSTKKLWHKESFTGTPFATTSFAATAVEVELDTYTYNEKIKGIWITVDCGEIFDESAVTRTIRLEIQQELEMLVSGKSVPCDNIKISFIKSKEKPGQVSGLVHNTLPAAFTSALSLALATQLTKLPCTEKRLFDLIKERETELSEDYSEQKDSEITEVEKSEGGEK